MKLLTRSTTTWLAGLLLAALGPAALATDLPGPLVPVDWLVAHRADVQVVEVRSDLDSFNQAPELSKPDAAGARTVDKAAGQIPGSLVVDFNRIRVDREVNGVKAKMMLPGRDAFQQMMREAGLQAGKPVVIASLGQDVTDLDEAARLFWQLKVYGADQVALLDGGTAAWLQAGQEVGKRAPAAAAGDWSASEPRTALVASSDQVASATAHGVQLLDARPMAQFYGTSKKPVVAAFGHIAGARAMSPEVLVRQDHGVVRFHPAGTYRDILAQLGFDPAAETITYCNTGHLASGAWFALSQVAGNPRVSLYDGSMHLWTLEKRPVVAVAR